jgi:3-oxoacyl-[acyl-carrier protein] reductase
MSASEPSGTAGGRERVVDRWRLDGRTALLVGAGGGGIGTEIAAAFSDAGADLVVMDLSEEQLAPTVERVESSGGSIETHLINVLDREGMEAAIAPVLERDVHILANVAGGAGKPTPILDYPAEQFDEVLARNLSYVFFTCRAAARSMIDHGIKGSIVNVASNAGLVSAHNVGPYGLAKSGVMTLTRTMAVEWGQYGIRVNAVAPGGTETPRILATFPQGLENSARWNPLQRNPHGSDIASAALFLASDMGWGLTGQVLVADCGASVRTSPWGGVDLAVDRAPSSSAN